MANDQDPRGEYRFFCSYHIGDQIFTLWFLNAAARYWPNVRFSFWVEPKYHDEVQRLARKVPNLTVVTGDKGPHNLEGWMGQDGYYGRRPNGHRFIDFMLGYHAFVAKKYGLPEWPMKDRREMLLPAECMDPEHPLKGQSFDVLFINSQALSGQCGHMSQEEVNSVARHCASRLKTITTHPCGLGPSTTELGLKLAHLGELASRCKVVIGVANAPLLVTFNELAFPSIQRWVAWSNDWVNFDDQRVTQAKSCGDLLKAVNEL